MITIVSDVLVFVRGPIGDSVYISIVYIVPRAGYHVQGTLYPSIRETGLLLFTCLFVCQKSFSEIYLSPLRSFTL